MSEIILCPQCQRRLRVSADLQTEVARCPSCEATFPVASAIPASSSIQTALPPPPKQPAPAVRPRPKAVRRPARNPCLIVAVVIGAALLILAGGTAALVAVLWPFIKASPTSSAARFEEDEEERREQLRQAFKDRKPATEDEIAKQVKPMLDELGEALSQQNAGRIMVAFDVDRLVEELAAICDEPLLKNPRQRREFRSGVTQGFAITLTQRGQVFHWKATEIRSIKRLNNDEAIVIARHKHPNGASLKMRWWVTRRDGDWKIYDFEDLDGGSRASSAMAALLNQGLGHVKEISPTIKTIGDAIQAVALGDVDGAEQKLAQVRGVRLPPLIESTRQLATGMVLLQRGKFPDAVKALDEANRLQPDLPVADYLRGVALNRLGKSDQALKYLRVYRDLLGDDAQVCHEIATALRAQGRGAEAVKEYQKALGFDPKDEEVFEECASLLFDEEQDDQLQKLLDTRAKDFPDSIDLARFRYRLLIRRNKTAEGVALFKSTLAKADAKDKRAELASEFVSDMLEASKPLEGYRAAPDASQAFRQLASNLLVNDRWDDLRQLLQAHRAGHADDPWLAYYQAEVHQHEEAWDKAAKVLSAALKRDARDARESIQTNCIFVLYKMGQWQRAYKENEPHDKTFTQLANLMANDKKGTELEALVRTHKPHAGDDPDVPFYEARAKVLMKKWAEAVPLFRQAYQKQKDEEIREDYQMYFLLDLAAQGRWHEGYQAAVDKNAAFLFLAGQLLSEKKDKELTALLEEHHQGGGGEPWYSFYLGELHLLRGDAREAAGHFAVALAKGKKEEQWRLRDGLFRARVKSGEAMRAYAEHKADEGTFESLAQLCGQNKDTKQLQALLDAHRKDKPDDPSLVSWELELLWLKQDYEGTLRFLTRHREDVLSQSQSRWKADGYRVRCLVRLKRRDEAVRAAKESVTKHSGDRLLLVLAHAAAGDVPQTIAAMGKLGKNTFFVRRCYEDEDLGPILRSKEFQAFRAKFPEPKDGKAANDK